MAAVAWLTLGLVIPSIAVDTLINVTTHRDQRRVAMAVSPGSTNVMLVWEDLSSSDPDLRARILVAATGSFTPEFPVQVLTNGPQLFPSIAGTSNGFVVAFQTQGFYTNGYAVAARRFLEMELRWTRKSSA